jgi:hypothetical protein
MTDIILWDETGPFFGLVRLEDHVRNLAAFSTLLNATTMGEVRDSNLPGWVRELASLVHDRLAAKRHLGPRSMLADSEPWDLSVLDVDNLLELSTVAAPWSHAQIRTWLSDDLYSERLQMDVQGESAGHSSSAQPRDLEGLLTALRHAGFVTQHHPGVCQVWDEFANAIAQRLA